MTSEANYHLSVDKTQKSEQLCKRTTKYLLELIREWMQNGTKNESAVKNDLLTWKTSEKFASLLE